MDMGTTSMNMNSMTEAATSSVMSMMSAISTMSSDMSSMSKAMATASSSMVMATTSSSMAMPMATSASNGSDHGMAHGMGGGMDMGSGSCSMHMIWNWQTIDSCFLSSGWHIRNSGQFAGTCIGVFLWVMFLVFFSRVRQAFDNYIVQNQLRRYTRATGESVHPPLLSADNRTPAECVPAGRDCPAKGPDTDISSTGKLSKEDHYSISKFSNIQGFFAKGSSMQQITSGSLLTDPQGFAVRASVYEQVIRALLYGFEYSIIWLLGLILMSYNGYVIISAFLGATIGFLLLNWETMYIGKANTPAAPLCC